MAALAHLIAHAGGVVGIALLVGMVAFLGLVWLHNRPTTEQVEEVGAGDGADEASVADDEAPPEIRSGSL